MIKNCLIYFIYCFCFNFIVNTVFVSCFSGLPYCFLNLIHKFFYLIFLHTIIFKRNYNFFKEKNIREIKRQNSNYFTEIIGFMKRLNLKINIRYHLWEKQFKILIFFIYLMIIRNINIEKTNIN